MEMVAEIERAIAAAAAAAAAALAPSHLTPSSEGEPVDGCSLPEVKESHTAVTTACRGDRQVATEAGYERLITYK